MPLSAPKAYSEAYMRLRTLPAEGDREDPWCEERHGRHWRLLAGRQALRSARGVVKCSDVARRVVGPLLLWNA
jgi:hypothetical protein